MKTRSVLIVDDEKNIRLMLSRALETLDLQTDTAVNGEEALGRLEEKEYGAMLLDLKMPGMHGLEVLRRARELRPDLPIVVITAHGTVESAVEAMKLGAADFIQKPFSPDEIRNLVSRVQAEGVTDYASCIDLAKRCIAEKRTDAAIVPACRAIAIDPSRPEAFNLLGVLLESRGEDLEAQKNFRAALSLDPTYGPALANLHKAVSRKVSRQ